MTTARPAPKVDRLSRSEVRLEKDRGRWVTESLSVLGGNLGGNEAVISLVPPPGGGPPIPAEPGFRASGECLLHQVRFALPADRGGEYRLAVGANADGSASSPVTVVASNAPKSDEYPRDEYTSHAGDPYGDRRFDYRKSTVTAIVRAGFVCHIGFVEHPGSGGSGSAGRPSIPRVLPSLYAPFVKDGTVDSLYVHGSAVSRLTQLVRANKDDAGFRVCVTVNEVNGVVLGRSLFHHSINYRSAVMYGRPALVPRAQKRRAFEILNDHLVPGRGNDPGVRTPSVCEREVTEVIRIPVTHASAKVRQGDVGDEEFDTEADRCWAGVIPLRQVYGPPQTAAGVGPAHRVPDYARNFRQQQ
ncbi:pyridoxamine 5'-phosphate oxidase family protein [Streptomyces aidingensis]|uniref:Nitroimidazol reductase NimA, pyridoxamine 5'-phosphate oxidase superfamily n=1 Tax=Streptomyces aidingensis TaxID=910347 RepID=A0A1I1MUC4_9ACTN|nr:pyridoxamine 5'-phosphate oxidase family protein [Streptomyces aidingensis]SFC88969.1 Nitroimidazol reductase NimA, pyridoxamine 5'-phosphate oxidase superfamily [Streptomyces aidingensis]